MTENQPYHIPALLAETIDGLDIRPNGTYIDATFGGAGHSRAILARLGREGHLYSFDRDRDALANVETLSAEDKEKFTFVLSDFRYISNFMRYYSAGKADGILADLGVSFHHFDTAERGFSFRADAPLDMRMNRNATRTAADIINSYTTRELARILTLYGDFKRPMPMVAAIDRARAEAPILTTDALRAAVAPCINPRQEKKELAQVFQALRIVVNDEMAALENLLQSSLEVLRPGGRLAVLTYHSLEDRMVKNFFRSGNIAGEVHKDLYGRPETPWEIVTRNPIMASEAEVEANPRARSAKLRIATLKADGKES